MNFYMPTKIYSGKDCVIKNASVFAGFGKRALIVTGKKSAKICGALDDVLNVLLKNNIKYQIFDMVLSNPTVECCYEGGKIAKDYSADFIVAIGGGSPLDAAKAIAMYATNDIEPLDIYSGEQKNKPLPIIAIPTTAGTGSEVTQYSVLTVHSQETKKGFSTSDTFARVSFLDAKYTLSLPINVTIDTAIDALSHALESILNKDTTVLSELYAKESIKLFGKSICALCSGELDYNTRENLLYASTYAGIAIAQTRTSVVHSMGYPLTYYKGLSHGYANGVLLATFLEMCEKVKPDLVSEVLSFMGLNSTKEFEELMIKLLPNRKIISDDEAKEYAKKTIKARNVLTCIWDITEEDEYYFFSKLTI